MRYTKAALLVFGLGLMIGFVVVVGEFPQWERAASFVMALGLALLPLGLFADSRGIVVLRWIALRFSRGKRRPKHGGRTRSNARPRKVPLRATSSRAPRRARF